MACTEEEDRIEKRMNYKEVKRAAKKAVTETKNRGYENLYRKLDTKKGEKQIFKLARTRAKHWQDLEAVKYIKDEGDEFSLDKRRSKPDGSTTSPCYAMSLGGQRRWIIKFVTSKD